MKPNLSFCLICCIVFAFGTTRIKDQQERPRPPDDHS